MKSQTEGVKYTFRASPASESYYRYVHVNIRVEGLSSLKLSQNVLAIPTEIPKFIHCEATGFPVPQLTWKYNGVGVTISSSAGVRQFTRQYANSRTLVFKSTARTEVGNYTCNAETTIAEQRKETNITLFVLGKLVLITRAGKQSESPSEFSSFSCTYKGYPVADIRWAWGEGGNSKHIRPNETGSMFNVENVVKITLSLYQSTSNLTVKLPEYLGRNTISCYAINGYETTSRSSFQMNNVFIGAQKHLIENATIWKWDNGEFLCNESSNGKWKTGSIGRVINGSFVAWNSGEPNKSGKNCVVMDYARRWFWSDAKCNDRLGFMCESSVAGIPQDFVVTVERCSANVTVKWKAGEKAVDINHRIEVRKAYLANGNAIEQVDKVPVDSGPIIEQFFNLKLDTKYNLTISVCPECSHSYKITKFVSTYAIVAAANLTVSAANVTRKMNTCVLKWSLNFKGIMGFRITAHSVIAHAVSRKYSDIKNVSVYGSSHENSERIIITAPNLIYTFKIAVETCTGLGPPKTFYGNCISRRSEPTTVPAPTVTQESNEDGAMEIQVRFPDESNGPLSCIFVIVVYMPDVSRIESAKYGLQELHNAASKAAIDSHVANDAYLALAITKSEVSSEVEGNGYVNRILGDESQSECDVTTDMISKRKRRSAEDNNVKAINRKLEDEASYSFFVVTATPASDGKVLFQTSQKSFFVKPSRSISVVTLVGVTIPSVIVVCLVLAALAFIKKRKATTKQRSEDVVMQQLQEDRNNQENVYANLAIENKKPRSETDIRLAALQNVYRSLSAKDNADFKKQFEKLKEEAQKQEYPTEIASNPSLKKKNRYKNILPSDASRVILSGEGESSYINACYIHGFSCPKKFIATQGPLPATVNDFWRMIVEQNCTVIAMLTKCKENTKIKCEKYWPDLGTIHTFDDIKVENKQEKTYGSFTLTTLVVNQGIQTITVNHIHFLNWPDHGVPVTTTDLLSYHEAVSKYRANTPMVVHCSAGAGRTGAFIAFDFLSEETESLRSVDVYNCVLKLRKQRVDMVQNCEQYILVYKMILEKHLFGKTEIAIDEMSSTLPSDAVIQKEFRNLSAVAPISHLKFGDQQKYRALNRDRDVIPYEQNRVTIMMKGTEADIPYINASTLGMYEPRTTLIAAQGPMKASVEHFWRAVIDNNVSTIVMLTGCAEGKKEQCAKYWPQDQESMTIEGITVCCRHTTVSNQLIVRELQVFREEEEKVVVQYQYVGWKSDEIPDNVSDILELIERMQSNLNSSEGGKALIHCSDGAGRTGSLCAIVNLLERLKCERKVDVFRAVKDLRDFRPGMVRTMEQYRFCYEAVFSYLTSFHLYSNFEVEQQEQPESVYQNL